MRIRSITCFLTPKIPLDEAILHQAGTFLSNARSAYQAKGYEVQTVRLATIPFPLWLPILSPDHAIQLAQQIEQIAQSIGVDYVSLGPALPQFPSSYALIPDMLAATQHLFFSGMIASREEGISIRAIRQCAQVIHNAASLSSDGFANLRFTALANVPPGSPFFPAAYHLGEGAAFAIATEAADLAVEVFSHAESLSQAQEGLVASLELHANAITAVSNELANTFQVDFKGIDFSLAPFPETSRSIGKAIECLGVAKVGVHGSLAAAALLANAIDIARFCHVGFSGLMLPLLEDSTLAQRAAQDGLTINDLLLYSTVCGTGLDTLPLPGNTTEEQLAAILLDLAALAMRLNKPLTARLMPIPGKVAGDTTDFDFAYFANSRVLPVRAEPLHGLLGSAQNLDTAIHINPLQRFNKE
jgi:uncharacterized protein (UPF0210 family)